MTYEDYEAAQSFIEEKSSTLLTWEKKDFAQIGFPIANYTEYKIDGRVFLSASNNIFKGVLRTHLLEAMEKFPLSFGNGNADSVVHALEKQMHIVGGRRSAENLLKNETCCWILEIDNGRVIDKILRIDLFRNLIKIPHTTKYEFIGGLFHAFKHFSYNNKPLSTEKANLNLQFPEAIINKIIQAFFIEQGNVITHKGKEAYNCKVPYDANHYMLYSFYQERKTNVYFLNTITMKNKKP